MTPFLPLIALAVAGPADRLVLPFDAPFVSVTVDGVAMRLRVAFDAPAGIALTPGAAARAHLVSVARSTVLVGPVTLAGGTATADLAFGGAHRRTRAIWTGASPTGEPGVDGLVSPAALPVGTLRMTRLGRMGRAETAGPTATMAARVDPASGIVARMAAEGGPIDLLLAPGRADSIATASAGAMLLAVMGGTLAPADPPARIILFGIDRPVRWLTLARPLRVAGLTLGRLLVRTADFAGDARLPAADESANPDEIVVTGGRPGSASPPRLRLSLGADVLGRCAAISWQAATSRLILECP